MKGSKVFFKRCIALLMCVFILQAKAQIKHVIYIQTEDKKPFYVTVNGQTKNSTESGYIILSQITDSIYTMLIGSPNNDFSEQKFVINMSNNDWEFSFRKNNNEYELYDMIHSTALSVYKEPVLKPVEQPVIAVTSPDSVQQKTVVKVDSAIAEVKESKFDTAVVVNSIQQNIITKVPTDTVMAVQSSPVNEVKDITVTTTPAVKMQSNNKKAGFYKITKIFERVSPQGVDLIYVDERKPKFDTVAIFIPAVPTTNAAAEANKKITEPIKTEPVVAVPVPEPEQKVTVKDTVKAVVAKSHCADVATDDDFLNFRKQLAAANNEEEMLTIAENNFTRKCYSINQIKNLGVLFLNEKNKFSFFTLAKPATFDSKDFYKLINQFTQPDLIEKFAGLLQQ